ncbi:TPA: AbrB/MazE/SpoVT family DNA-binding domain-containing protein [Candidatus Micrarchaeota archaeon]|nr:AbrB/MazE/SpoVT family DNA-binding domain-containing protein [Candidatus Micrarchaeota archaeon]
MEVAFTKMSEKGQVVIPKDVRSEVDFKPSDKFIVYGLGNAVVIKKVNTESAVRNLEKVFKFIDSRDIRIDSRDVEREIRAVRRNRIRK